MNLRSGHVIASAVAATMAIAALSACSSPGSGSAQTTSAAGTTASATGQSSAASIQVDATARALLPASFRTSGTVNLATDASSPPNEFVGPDGHTIEGFDPDLARAAFAKLGLKVNFINASFDTIIPGLESGKYDVGWSSHTDTAAREKVVTFVDYMNLGASFITLPSGGKTVQGFSDLCGLAVAAEAGTTEYADATAQVTKCTQAGKTKPTIQVYPDDNALVLAIVSQRAEVGMLNQAIAAYQAKQHGQIEVTGKPFDLAPAGAIVANKNAQLAQAILAGLKDTVADGQYGSILAKWGVSDAALKPAINITGSGS